ncbi:CAP domain-containing protein [Biscogniauxia marginata]|nr:CAP domain-containing protein [Biscogniauxia marginata]
MRSSLVVAATSAVLAMASPLEKRKMETKWVMEYLTVTVTGSGDPEPTPELNNKYQAVEEPAPNVVYVTASPEPPAPTVVYVTASPDPPAPAPTTTSPSVVIVTETYQPQPTTESPVAVPVSSTSTTEAQAEPTEPAGDDFVSSALYHHNLHRGNHSSQDVDWDAEIAGYAQITANTCKFAHDMTEGNGGYGQNIAMWGTTDDPAKLGSVGAINMAITNFWYDGELAKFKDEYYGQATPDMSDFESWGHLTQLIWNGSNKIGCAVKLCPAGTMSSDMSTWYMVCNYSPPGNVGGAYAQNVKRPLGKVSISV